MSYIPVSKRTASSGNKKAYIPVSERSAVSEPATKKAIIDQPLPPPEKMPEEPSLIRRGLSLVSNTGILNKKTTDMFGRESSILDRGRDLKGISDKTKEFMNPTPAEVIRSEEKRRKQTLLPSESARIVKESEVARISLPRPVTEQDVLDPEFLNKRPILIDAMMGSGGRKVAGLSDDLINKITRSTKVPEIRDVLKTSRLILEDEIDDVARQISKTKSTSQVEKILNQAELRHGFFGAKKAEMPEKLNAPAYVPVAEREAFKNYEDLSTRLLSKLEGRTKVSKQFISDLTNSPDLKQTEKDIFRNLLETEGDEIDVPKFAEKVKGELLPLERKPADFNGDPKAQRYENVTLPDELRGNVANYSEHVYDSPIKTSAGGVHFPGKINYFGHTRIEDLAPSNRAEVIRTGLKKGYYSSEGRQGRIALRKELAELEARDTGGTRRILEIQSDLYQKGRIEKEFDPLNYLNPNDRVEYAKLTKQLFYPETATESKEIVAKKIDGLLDTAKDLANKDAGKLQQYSNPTAHFRMVREEIKKAAQDGKTKLQFPTGETAMKIEGLGRNTNWRFRPVDPIQEDELGAYKLLEPQHLKAGMIVRDATGERAADWIVTDVLGDGKFKAVPKDKITRENVLSGLEDFKETFDISGKVDTNNPIYKFYEKELGRYLSSKYGATRVVDPQGVSWYELDLKGKGYDKAPVEAFKAGRDSLFDLSRDEARKLVAKYFSEKEIGLLFSDDIGEGLLGKFSMRHFRNVIAVLTKDNMVSSSTLYHEVFHAVFNLRLTTAERSAAIQKVLKDPRIMQDLAYNNKNYKTPEERAEEWLADDFARYKKGPEKYQGFFRNLWEKLLNYVRGLIRRANRFDNLYNEIDSRKMAPAEEALPIERFKAANDDGSGYLDDINRTSKDRAKSTGEQELKSNKLDKDQGEIPGIDQTYAKRTSSPADSKVVDTYKDSTAAKLSESIRYSDIEDLAKSIKAKDITEQKIEEMGHKAAFIEQTLAENPAKGLMRYLSHKTGRLPEVTGKPTRLSIKGDKKIVKNSKFGIAGDDIVKTFGFEDLEDAEKALDRYIEARKRFIQVKKDLSILRKERSAIRKGEQLMSFARGQRRARLRVLKDRYNLSDAELVEVRQRRDIMAMAPQEFDEFIIRAEEKAAQIEERRMARIMLEATIQQKELSKVENLQQAMKLPPIEKMTTDQMKTFDGFLQQFKQGDRFLGVRQLETVKNTDLSGIYTIREAREKLAKEAGVPIEELDRVKFKWIDKYLYDTALAQKNPFYSVMVDSKNRAVLNANANLYEHKKIINNLIKKARESRQRNLIERFIPTDKRIFEWLESTPENKLVLAADMTDEELKAAQKIRDLYSEARDYLIQHNVLKKFKADYITHIRRGFLEAWKEDGLMRAFKETFEQYKQDEAYLNILDEKTGEILPLEKFFQFSMRRSGSLTPTKNVADAVIAYFATLEKKRALDWLVPKLDIYAHSLTPQALSPSGLELDDSLKRFLKTWINTKKGRAVSMPGIEPGKPIDWALRTGVALTRLLDLGLNIPTGLAANVGEQITTFVGLGTNKYALGLQRLATKKGRDLTEKYAYFVGDKLMDKLTEASSSTGEKLISGIFGLFSAASRRANQIHLLGSMTSKEYQEGMISAARLAEIQNEIGRWRAVEGSESVLGKTSLGSVITQYRKWAVPIFTTSVNNLYKIASTPGLSNKLSTREFRETLRGTLVTLVIGLALYYSYSEEDDKDGGFIATLQKKAARDSFSLIAALDPTFWTKPSRLSDFVLDLATIIKQAVPPQTDKNGELKSIKGLKNALVPNVVKQLGPKQSSDEASIRPPKMNVPKLPKPPKNLRPELPNI